MGQEHNTRDDQHRSFIILLPWLIEKCIATVFAVLLAPGVVNNQIFQPPEEFIQAVLELNRAGLEIIIVWFAGKSNWHQSIPIFALINS